MALAVAGLTGIFPFSPLLSMPFPSCPPGGGKGPVMGALPPFEAPFQTPESPPVHRAEPLCSLPACSESEAFVGTRGHRADGEALGFEREGEFRGRLQGGASGGGNRRFPTTGPSLAPPGGHRGQLQKESNQAEKRLKVLQAARAAFASLARPEGLAHKSGINWVKRKIPGKCGKEEAKEYSCFSVGFWAQVNDATWLPQGAAA